MAGHRPAVPVAWEKLEAAAQAVMSREAWAYVAGGAGRESTMAANRTAFERWCIVPRVLRDVAEVVGNVLAEFDLTLGLAGCTNGGGINREILQITA